MYLPINLGTTIGIAYCVVVMFLMLIWLGKPNHPKSKKRDEEDDMVG